VTTAIRIVDYQPDWPNAFATHANAITAALGARVLQLEHIGSTSVPGLAAKPIIDILLVVFDSADERAYLPDLEAAGFHLHLREPSFYEHRLLKTPGAGVHLHVYSRDCPEVRRVLLFRDRLRANPADRELYESTKRELARRTWTDMDAYATAKTKVVERILAAAQTDR
jgi:GrpB-like predicted nucleotidyltransferase (UPF0157 family)